MDMYTKKVINHFKEPRNQGIIEDASAIGQEGNPVCGDIMKIYLKIEEREVNDKKEEYIQDIKFETLGCAAAIAVSSALTEMAKKKSLEEALKITKDDVVEYLDGLPIQKVHCSMLGVDALKQAINKYIESNK